MGTLTADVPRLPEYCDHKLPASCRLTSIPNCCACADERPHSLSYPTYIDGVGFVARASRQARYCWYCAEFWDNRIAQTNLLPSQTRLPEVPDQSDFLARWYEFYNGYRLVTRPDGSEERIAVLGEPFRDVSPGCLPRTLDELRAGHERSNADQRRHIQVARDESPQGPSLDEALGLMLESAQAEAEDAQPPAPISSLPPTPRVAGNVMQPAPSRNHEYQARRIAALRRELLRMRNGVERVISGLRDLGETVPDSIEATGRLSDLGRTLDVISATNNSSSSSSHQSDPSSQESRAPLVGAIYRDPALTNIQQRLDEAQRQLQQAQRFREQSATEFQLAQASHNEAAEVLESAELDLTEHREQLSQLRREQRTAENYARLFGTREDMERQGTEYESPISGMFTRAWERFRVAEQVRREERTLRQVLEDEQRAPGQALADDRIEMNPAANTVYEDHLNEYYTMLRRQGWIQPVGSDAGRGAGLDTNSSGTSIERPQDEPQQPTQPQVIAAQANESNGTATGNMSTLERLLRNTPEPQRSSIIARMVENGTAQALEQSTDGNFVDVWRRLRDVYAPWDEESESEVEEDLGGRGLDAQDSGRPEPKEDSDMTLRLDCKICYTQVADTACLPCGHLVMCQWCSEQHSPVMQHDRTRPRRPANCPVCRKKVKQKVRIYRA